MQTELSDPPSGAEHTRQRLLTAGLVLFGRDGLHGVTTRTLAEEAGVNLNAIPYHFGGKHGLYMAVAHHITETTGAAIRSAGTGDLRSAESLTPEDARQLAGRIVSQVVRIILGAADSLARGGFIIREQLQPSAAFDVLYDGFMEPVHGVLSGLVARVLGVESSDRTAILHAHGLMGQALIFGVAREMLLRRLGEAELNAERIDEIAAAVNAQVIAALRGLQHEKEQPHGSD